MALCGPGAADAVVKGRRSGHAWRRASPRCQRKDADKMIDDAAVMDRLLFGILAQHQLAHEIPTANAAIERRQAATRQSYIHKILGVGTRRGAKLAHCPGNESKRTIKTPFRVRTDYSPKRRSRA